MLEVFPPVIGALMIASLMAAIMSTVDSQLIYVTASMTNDIYLQFINKNPDEKKLNRLAHVITFVVGLFTLYVARRRQRWRRAWWPASSRRRPQT